MTDSGAVDIKPGLCSGLPCYYGASMALTPALIGTALVAPTEEASRLHDDVGTIGFLKGCVLGRTLRLGKTPPLFDGARGATVTMTMGRPRTSEGPTTKVSVVVPSETARQLRIMAAEQGASVAQLVDDWTRKARLLEAVERGRRAVAEGDFVSHKEAGRRLKKWASHSGDLSATGKPDRYPGCSAG